MMKDPYAPEIRADWEQLCAGLNLPVTDPVNDPGISRARTREMSPELIAALVDAAEEHKP